RGSRWASGGGERAVPPGYVGGGPLGWNARPAAGWNGGPVATPSGRHGGPWRAWTVVPTTAFARGGSITRAPIDPQALHAPSAQAFIMQREAPTAIVPRLPRGTFTPKR